MGEGKEKEKHLVKIACLKTRCWDLVVQWLTLHFQYRFDPWPSHMLCGRKKKKKKDGATVETSKSRRMAALDSNAGSLGSSGGHINKALISLGNQWFLALSGSWSALHAMCAC